jgi:hypothetical protein
VDLPPLSAGQEIDEAFEHVAVRFWDSRRIARYELRQDYHFERKTEGTITSVSMWSTTHEEQIEGP